MTGILNALIAGVSGAVKDAYFNLVSLLLPGNGTNGAQNNTFLDSSTNNFTITRNGNTTQGTFSPFSQTEWGNYFGGSADWLTTSSSVTALGAGNWTVEFWLYPTTSGTTRIISDARTSSQGLYPLFGLSTANAAIFYINTTTVLSSTNTVSANTWTHVAFVKNSATTTCYINGVASGSFSDSNTYLANPITFGASGFTADSHASKFTGYISNYRQVVGRAVYTSDFTPPTSPLGQTSGGQNPPTGTQTSLLTCQSNRFVDNSSSPYTITPSGSPSVVAFSPFAPTAAYTTAAVGGSGYFDGTGDYLSIANNAAFNFGSGAFTIELWYYPTTLSGTQCLITNYGGSTTGFVVQMGGSTAGSGKIDAGFSGDGADITSTNTVQLNSWNHIAISGTPGATGIKLFINGNQEGSTYTGATSLDTSAALLIGEVASTNRLSGYLSGLRLLKGTALYTTSTYTVPTAPLTAITNTSLLLNFTNAGITDATAKNDLETVGNAQISTSVSKFGGGSIAFDGTGDYLVPSSASSNILLGFGTGDFTIEFWVYFAGGLGSDILLYDGRPLSTNGAYPTIYVNSSSQLSYVVSSADRITSSSAFSTSIWYHIAVSRSGTSTKMFVNGAQVGSTYTDSTNYLSAARRPTIGINGFNESAGGLNGYIDDLRVSRVARYTSNFTAPTAPFPVQ